MTPTTKAKATYADLVAVPDHLVAELIDGELFVTPRPAVPHAYASSQLGADLVSAFTRGGADGPGGWVILGEPELHFGNEPHAVVPDLAGWRRERFPREAFTATALTIVPDWVCEVVSPSTERLDRAVKLPLYLRQGVRYAWLVNPILLTLEVYVRSDTGWQLQAVYSENAVAQAPPFDTYALDLSRLWIAP